MIGGKSIITGKLRIFPARRKVAFPGISHVSFLALRTPGRPHRRLGRALLLRRSAMFIAGDRTGNPRCSDNLPALRSAGGLDGARGGIMLPVGRKQPAGSSDAFSITTLRQKFLRNLFQETSEPSRLARYGAGNCVRWKSTHGVIQNRHTTFL